MVTSYGKKKKCYHLAEMPLIRLKQETKKVQQCSYQLQNLADDLCTASLRSPIF